MKGALPTLLQSFGRRRINVALLLGLLVAGTALLVQAQVEGTEDKPPSDVQAGGEDGWSRQGTFVTSARPFPSRHAGYVPGSEPSLDVGDDRAPIAVRRLLPTPTPGPLPTPDGIPRCAVVPVLMYHHVGEPDPAADAIRRDLSVSPDDFEAQLRYLIEHGFEPVTLESLVTHLQLGHPLPLKPVILTFDDGFKDQYTNAYPLLRKYGFVGTFFIITRFADEERPEYMSWSEIELLHADGMEIGSHSYTHPSLYGKSFDYVVWQVLGSKEAIEARTQEPVRFFSYPSGQYDQLTIDVVRSAGYWGAVTVEAGSMQTAERPFEFKRIRVRGSYDLSDFDHWLNHWLSNP
ncbi:MAG: polysaccharide deacetylase family protein [Anaerolineae bacterium]